GLAHRARPRRSSFFDPCRRWRRRGRQGRAPAGRIVEGVRGSARRRRWDDVGRRVSRERRARRHARVLRGGFAMTARPRRSYALDHWIGFVLAFFYLVVLVKTAHQLGYARDEGFYFSAASSYSN